MALIAAMFLLTDSWAGAIELDVLASATERSQAASALARSRRQVAQAQQHVDAARSRLKAFLRGHFEPAESDLQLPPDARAAANPEAEQIEQQLAELRSEREKLLETFTEAHPEVVDLDERRADLEARLERLKAPALNSAGDTSAEVSAARQAADAAEYRSLLADVDAAEHELAAARAAESAAADRLAAIGLLGLGGGRAKPAHEALPPIAGADSTPPAEAAAPGLIDAEPAQPRPRPIGLATADPIAASRTQSLALAALALAVVLAALAAVRLARATSDPLFASADEAAAALGVPVVGIVPRPATRGDLAGASLRWTLFVVAVAVLGGLAIAGVAYLVVHFDAVSAFVSDPVAGVRNLLSA